MTKIAHLICVGILISLSLLAFVEIPASVQGGSPPPPDDGIDGLQYIDGDWDVSGVESYTDETIILTGNLTILNGGSLTLNNVNLRMNNTFANGIYNIEVQTGGALNILSGSNITDSTFDVDDGSGSDYRFMFWLRKDSNFQMMDSELHEVGWDNNNPGLVVDTNGTTFTNVLITNCKNGIMFNWTSNHYLSDLTIMHIGSGTTFDGLLFYESTNNVVQNVYIDDVVRNGIFMWGADTTFVNVTCKNAVTGILLANAYNVTITDATISDTTLTGLTFYSSYNNHAEDVEIIDDGEILFEQGSSNNTIINATLTNSAHAVYSQEISRNNTIINSTIINSTFFQLNLDENSELILLNTSFNESSVNVIDSQSTLVVQWYLHVKVRSPPDNPVQDANVMVYNVTSDLVAEGQTASDGYLRWIVVTERVQTDIGNELFNPHNISATKSSKTGYVDPEPTLNFSQVLIINLDVAVPTAPLNPSTSAGDSYINLTWDAPASDGGSPVTNYEIYRGTTSGGEVFLIEIGNLLFYNDTSVTNGVPYYYKVSAKNANGEGSQSIEVVGTPGTGPTVPDPPQNLLASAGDSYVNLTWGAPVSDGGSPVTNYVIYRGTTSGGEVLLIEIGNLLYYNDTTVTNGVTYYYQVSAKNVIGEGLKSTEVDATGGGAPSAPQNLVAAAGDGYVYLSWEAPVDDGGFAVSNYRIYRGTSVGGEVFLIEVGDVLFYNDTGVTNGVPYYYEVTAPSSDGGSTITNYEIYRGTSSGGEVFLIETGDVLVYNDTTVTNDVTYYYKVSSKNGIGEGLQSNEVNATPAEPGAPQNQVPTVTLTSHSTGAKISGTVTFSGSSSDPDGTVQRVEIRFGSGSWIEVTGTTSWSYEWDTTAVDNGDHTIFIRSYDGTDYSTESSLTLTVDNPSDDGDGFDMTLILIIIIIIIVIIIIVVIAKRSSGGGAPPKELDIEERENF
jgi:fibronectin type 3 domain-containing protein